MGSLSAKVHSVWPFPDLVDGQVLTGVCWLAMYFVGCLFDNSMQFQLNGNSKIMRLKLCLVCTKLHPCEVHVLELYILHIYKWNTSR